MALVAKYNHEGQPKVDTLALAKYYEQTHTTGSSVAGSATLVAPAYGLTIRPLGTADASYRMTMNPDYAGAAQVAQIHVTGELLQGGDVDTIVTAAAVDDGTPTTVSTTVLGARQVETLTVVGTTNAAGTLDVYLTTALYRAGTENIEWSVDVGSALVPTKVAEAIYDEIGATISPAGTPLFTLVDPGGTTDALVLTAYRAAANDAACVFGYEDQLNLTDGTSANTTAGVAADSTSTIAGKIVSALNADAAIDGTYLASASGTLISFTIVSPTINDPTLLLSLENDSTIGITENQSTITTYGTGTGDGHWFTAAAGVLTSLTPPSRVLPDELYTFREVWLKAAEAVEVELTYWGYPGTGTGVCS